MIPLDALLLHDDGTEDPTMPAPKTTTTPEVRVGQIWRDDVDDYLYRIVAIDREGKIWVRHPNALKGGHIVRRGWFEHWTLTRDVEA